MRGQGCQRRALASFIPPRPARVNGVGEAESQLPVFSFHHVRAPSFLVLSVRLERTYERVRHPGSHQEPRRRVLPPEMSRESAATSRSWGNGSESVGTALVSCKDGRVPREASARCV